MKGLCVCVGGWACECGWVLISVNVSCWLYSTFHTNFAGALQEQREMRQKRMSNVHPRGEVCVCACMRGCLIATHPGRMVYACARVRAYVNVG